MAWDNGGYLREQRCGRQQLLHRWVWEEAHGPIPDGMQVDHINGDTYDNRLENLRLVTNIDNAKNKKRQSNNKSGVTGVYYRKSSGKWRAGVGVDSGIKWLGTFDDWFEAVCARMSANNRYGFHENHGRR